MFDELLFLVSATLTIVGTLGVVFSKNLMHACIFLLGCLFGVAGLYATLGADFLAATQLVVYSGGVVILMLFGVMLTGGNEGPTNKYGIDKIPSMGNTKTYTIAGLSAFVAGLVALKIIASFMKTYEEGKLPPMSSTVDKIGTMLITDHILAFEISSILLLGALVGAAVIARPNRG